MHAEDISTGRVVTAESGHSPAVRSAGNTFQGRGLACCGRPCFRSGWAWNHITHVAPRRRPWLQFERRHSAIPAEFPRPEASGLQHGRIGDCDNLVRFHEPGLFAVMRAGPRDQPAIGCPPELHLVGPRLAVRPGRVHGCSEQLGQGPVQVNSRFERNGRVRKSPRGYRGAEESRILIGDAVALHVGELVEGSSRNRVNAILHAESVHQHWD